MNHIYVNKTCNRFYLHPYIYIYIYIYTCNRFYLNIYGLFIFKYL